MNPNFPQRPSDGLGQAASRMFVATIVPVFGLGFLRLILASLPMIKNAGPIADLGVTPLILIKAALDTVIYFLIMRFCLAVSGQMRLLRPHMAEIANIITLAGCALVATMAYSGYELLAASLAPTQMEIYNWLFLAIVLTPIAVIVVIVTRRVDFFSNLLFGKLTEAAAAPGAFAAAASSAGAPAPASWAPPASAPPAPMPPPAAMDPQQQEIRQRLTAVQQQVKAAQRAAESLQGGGRLSAELAESAAKMQSYLDGANLSADSRDWAGAKSFADWAEYESSRLLLAAK